MNLLQKIESEKTNGTSYVSENRSNMFYLSITVVYFLSDHHNITEILLKMAEHKNDQF
jgi:hypothetical protein